MNELDQLKVENAKLKLQLEKTPEAMGNYDPCPNFVDLPIGDDVRCGDTGCYECWRQALDTVVVDEAEVKT